MATKKVTTKLAKTAAANVEALESETNEQRIERKRLEARLNAAERAKKERAWLENNMAGNGRLKGRPTFYVRPFWELSEHDRAKFNRRHDIAEMFQQIEHKVHATDRELVFNALGGTVAFHQLTRLIEDLEFDESWSEHRQDMEYIRIGFDLALQALDHALRNRGVVLEGLSRGGKSKETPPWHADCVRAARTLLETGSAPHELTGKLAPRFQRDNKTIRSVLKKAGIK